MDRNEADAALASARLSERKLADRAHWPLWRHAAFGALEALIVVGIGAPIGVFAACLVLACVGLWWIMQGDRRRDGFFVSGFSSRAALPATFLACLVVLAGVFAIVLTGGLHLWTPLTPVVAGFVFLGCALSSIWWERLYRKDLLSGGVQ